MALSHNLDFPCVGNHSQLKFAPESYGKPVKGMLTGQ